MPRLSLPLLALILALSAVACEPAAPLEEGRWSGALTPMNHPEMANPVAYDVRHDGGELAVDLIGPGGQAIPTQSPRLEGDTLYFAFAEPEEKVLLRCALGRDGDRGFAGRCADDSGKWARFTMVPPGR